MAIDLYAATGPSNLNKGLEEIATLVIVGYTHGALLEPVIRGKGDIAFQPIPLLPIPAGNNAAAINAQAAARESNKNITKSNREAVTQSTQVVGFILGRLNDGSATTVKDHPHYNDNVGPDACRIEGRNNNCKRGDNETFDEFEARYGHDLKEAREAGNQIEADSFQRCQHFFSRSNLPVELNYGKASMRNTKTTYRQT